MSKYMIEAIGLVKDFRIGDTVSQVLREVSVDIAPGEFVSIMGPRRIGRRFRQASSRPSMA